MVRSIARCDWRQAVSESRRPTQFGRIHAPDERWLATQPPEPILEPELPIIDTHHHLWERPDHRYLLHEFLSPLVSEYGCKPPHPTTVLPSSATR